MQFEHKDIDRFASAMLLFNSVLLLAMIVQCWLRRIFAIFYSDIVVVCIAIILALLATNKASITVASLIIHKIFRLNI